MASIKRKPLFLTEVQFRLGRHNAGGCGLALWSACIRLQPSLTTFSL